MGERAEVPAAPEEATTAEVPAGWELAEKVRPTLEAEGAFDLEMVLEMEMELELVLVLVLVTELVFEVEIELETEMLFVPEVDPDPDTDPVVVTVTEFDTEGRQKYTTIRLSFWSVTMRIDPEMIVELSKTLTGPAKLVAADELLVRKLDWPITNVALDPLVATVAAPE